MYKRTKKETYLHFVCPPETFPCLPRENARTSLEQNGDYLFDVKPPQVAILLSHPNEDHRRPRDVHHRQGSPDLLLHRVPLGEEDPVDLVRLAHRRQLDKPAVELGELVDGLVPHKRLPDKEGEVGAVRVDQLGQRPHQGLVVLHPSRRVHQDHVAPLLLGLLQGLARHRGRVLLVPALKELHPEALGVRPELLHGPRPEGIARRDHDLHPVLHQPEGHLGQVGALAHTVATDEHNRVGLPVPSAGLHLLQDVDVPSRRQDLRKGVLQRPGHRGGHPREGLQPAAHHVALHHVHDLLCNLLGHVLGHELLFESFQDRPHVRLLQYGLAAHVDLLVKGLHHAAQPARLGCSGHSATVVVVVVVHEAPSRGPLHRGGGAPAASVATIRKVQLLLGLGLAQEAPLPPALLLGGRGARAGGLLGCGGGRGGGLARPLLPQRLELPRVEPLLHLRGLGIGLVPVAHAQALQGVFHGPLHHDGVLLDVKGGAVVVLSISIATALIGLRAVRAAPRRRGLLGFAPRQDLLEGLGELPVVRLRVPKHVLEPVPNQPQQVLDVRHGEHGPVHRDEDEAELVVLFPLHGVALVRKLFPRAVRLLDQTLFHEGVDGAIYQGVPLVAPQHVAAEREDCKVVQHGGGGKTHARGLGPRRTDTSPGLLLHLHPCGCFAP
mmetsp:Transcript_7881/g.23550  ORF Transcript_7881/g.23550 Transcript_7881/m.23550 type:complete len:665 (+) Transcript_7881:2115-4109(+)